MKKAVMIVSLVLAVLTLVYLAGPVAPLIAGGALLAVAPVLPRRKKTTAEKADTSGPAVTTVRRKRPSVAKKAGPAEREFRRLALKSGRWVIGLVVGRKRGGVYLRLPAKFGGTVVFRRSDQLRPVFAAAR